MTKYKRVGLVVMAGLALAAGCQHTNQPKLHGESFAPDDEPRAEQNIAASQAAVGAREDATLRPVHFNDAALNSLGQQKLDLMLGVEQPNAPLVVYLDFPAGAQPGMSHDSVTQYLKGHGLSDTQIKLVDGPNPRTLHSAADALAGLTAMQQAQTATAGTGTPAGAAPQPSGASSTPPAGTSSDNSPKY